MPARQAPGPRRARSRFTGPLGTTGGKGYDRAVAYDLTGGIHGHSEPLAELLHTLGYPGSSGEFRHTRRQVIVLGDCIDRGPDQRQGCRARELRLGLDREAPDDLAARNEEFAREVFVGRGSAGSAALYSEGERPVQRLKTRVK